MEPFPKKKFKKSKEIRVVSVDIELLCCCSVPNVKGLGPWIACDVCDKWYLQKCEGVNGSKIPKSILYACKNCQI